MHATMARAAQAGRPAGPTTHVLALVRRHPLAAYFALAFGVSWGGVALIAGPMGLAGSGVWYLVALLLAMVAGPSTAGLLLTGLLQGRAGYRDLLARLTRWRVAPRWWAAALLLNPLTLLVVLGALSRVSPAFLPGLLTTDTPAVVVTRAVALGLLAGLFEELGWTGFATPHLLRRHGYLAAGLALGVLWATWHIGPDLPVASAEWGARWPWRVLLWMYAGMVPYRVLMTWVYRHTGSLLLGVLMHAAYTGGQALLEPLGASQPAQLLWWGLLGVALGVLVGVVALADRPHLLRSAPPAGAALPL